MRYDPEMLKLLLEQMAVEAGVTLFYQTELLSARETGEGCYIRVKGFYQEMDLYGKYLIDATGNASLVESLGGRNPGCG